MKINDIYIYILEVKNQKIKLKITFKIALKPKILRNKFNKNVQDHYIENHKALLSETKEDK